MTMDYEVARACASAEMREDFCEEGGSEMSTQWLTSENRP